MKGEYDLAYVERFNKCLLNRALMEEDAKVLVVVGRLILNSDMWKAMHQ